MSLVHNRSNMSENVDIGVIGCGMVGNIHIENLLKLVAIDNIHICDISKDTLERTCNKYNIQNSYSQEIDLINNSKVHSIIICSPPITHFELIVKCISANKNLLIEKPIVTKIADLNKFQLLIQQKPELLVMDCSARHSVLHPKFDFIKSIVSDKDFGELYYIHHNAINRQKRPGVEYHPDAKWFTDKNISGGGPFIDWGVYDLAFHLGILNDRPIISSFYSNFYSGFDSASKEKDFTVEEHAVVMMEFDNLNFYYERSTNGFSDNINETRIYSSKMGLQFNYLYAEDKTIKIFKNSSTGEIIEEIVEIQSPGYNGYETDYYEMDKEFINCLLNKSTPKFPIENSIDFLRLLLRVYSKEIQKFR